MAMYEEDIVVYDSRRPNEPPYAHSRPTTEPRWIKWTLVGIAVAFMAVIIDDDTAMVSTETEVVRQRLSNARDRANLFDGAYAIRMTPACEMEFLLMSPQEGRIELVGLSLLPVNRSSVAAP